MHSKGPTSHEALGSGHLQSLEVTRPARYGERDETRGDDEHEQKCSAAEYVVRLMWLRRGSFTPFARIGSRNCCRTTGDSSTCLWRHAGNRVSWLRPHPDTYLLERNIAAGNSDGLKRVLLSTSCAEWNAPYDAGICSHSHQDPRHLLAIEGGADYGERKLALHRTVTLASGSQGPPADA